MRQRLNASGGMNLLATAIMAAVMMIILSAPAAAAPTLPDSITGRINEVITSPEEREDVLRKADAAVRAGVRTETVGPILLRALENGVSPSGLGEMLQVLSSAAERNLPSELLAGKIMEGLAKHVDERLIVDAMEKVKERLEFSGGLAKGLGIGREKREDLIIETAGAIAAGMDREALRGIFDALAVGTGGSKLDAVQIMEMVKAASGYGVDSRRVGRYAASLARDEDADAGDIIKLLNDLSQGTYNGVPDGDPDDILERHRESLSKTGEKGDENAATEEHPDDVEYDGSTGEETGGDEGSESEDGDGDPD